TSAQSMKIAASEAQWNTRQPCGFSLFQIGGLTKQHESPSFSSPRPRGPSYMATGPSSGRGQGLHQLQSPGRGTYGPGDPTPDRLVLSARIPLGRLPRARGL